MVNGKPSMSLGLKTSLNRPLLQKFEKILSGLKSAAANKTRLHQRFAILTLQWVDRNFRQSGRLTGAPWKKLTPNTIAGRRKQSSLPLRDTGQLAQSFVAKATSKSAIVGTEKQYASFHEEGVGPFTITPKKGKFLFFPVAKGFAGPKFKGEGGQFVGIAKKVNHPGITQRRILPKVKEILPSLISAGDKFMLQVIKKVGG